jgi:hypothetical protein
MTSIEKLVYMIGIVDHDRKNEDDFDFFFWKSVFYFKVVQKEAFFGIRNFKSQSSLKRVH